MTDCLCPTCGSPIALLSIVVSLNDNTVATAIGKVRVQPRLADLAKVMADRSPECVSNDRICHAMHGATQEWPSDESIRVSIWALRKKLRGIGIEIITVYGRGYRMALIEAGQ